MTVTVSTVKTALETRLVSIACCDQKPDSDAGGPSLDANTTTAATDRPPISPRHPSIRTVDRTPTRRKMMIATFAQ